MAGAEIKKRIITTCGYCLEQTNKKTEAFIKSPKTAHRIIGQFKDEELKQRVQIIMCTRCGTQTEWVPRHHMPKVEAMRLEAKYIADGYEIRERAKLAKQRRLAIERQAKLPKRKQRKG